MLYTVQVDGKDALQLNTTGNIFQKRMYPHKFTSG